MDSNELNEKLTALFSSAEAASSEGLADEAIKRCEEALEIMDFHYDEDLKFTPGDFLMVAGHACWEDNDLEGALRYYRQAGETDPGRLDAAVAVGVGLFHLGRFTAACGFLEMVTVEDPDIAEAWHYLGLIALRRGDRALAEVFLQRAHEKEPQRWLRPKFLEVDEIEKILNDCIERLPNEIRVALANVAIVLEEQMPDDLIHSQSPPLDPLILGLFEGMPITEESTFGVQTDLNRILIFAENIALIAEDEDRLREELEVTLKHEIGHYLGLDEDELAARGLD